MRFFLIVGGLFFIFLSVTGLIQTYEEIRVLNKGKLTRMRIVEIPGSCIGTKNKYHMRISDNEKTFLKRISGNFCESHNIGDVVELKYLNGSDIILFPDENPYNEYYSIVFLGVCGFGILIWYGLLNKPLYNFISKH